MNSINTLISFTEASGQTFQLGGGMLFTVIKTKLSEPELVSYYQWLKQNRSEDGLISMKYWMEETVNIRSRVREMVHGVEKTHNEKKKNNIRYQKNLPRTATNHTTMVTCDIKCPECRQGHSLEDCADFQRMSMKKRWNTVKKQRLCFQCLAPSHGMKDCDQRKNGDQS